MSFDGILSQPGVLPPHPGCPIGSDRIAGAASVCYTSVVRDGVEAVA